MNTDRKRTEDLPTQRRDKENREERKVFDLLLRSAAFSVLRVSAFGLVPVHSSGPFACPDLCSFASICG